MRERFTRRTTAGILGAVVIVALAIAAAAGTPGEGETSYIVQAREAGRAGELVREVGGEITHELGIIRAVGARLSARQAAALESLAPAVRLHENRAAMTAAAPGRGANGAGPSGNSKGGPWKQGRGGDGSPFGRTVFPSLVGADRLHDEGITGFGVTVAVLDTGIWMHNDLKKDAADQWRLLGRYDAIEDQESAVDKSGHGTHVTGIIASRRQTEGAYPRYDGIAPEAGLVVVRAFDEYGRGTYADVIRGLDWIVANRELYGIRVLNLSFGAPARSHYWDDPLNQAVMEAWRSGIVVVASAGNAGPAPMTVGVPGNVPYVVTVGAMSDNYTPGGAADDFVTSFSASGPTVEGFVKPELVAPGGHVAALMRKLDRIPRQHREFHDGTYFFVMSGTSQASAVVAGTAALVLQRSPELGPDDVKCRLMAAARPAIKGGALAYSVFEQGAGLVDAYAAVHGTAAGCANRGLDVDLDLAGIEHYGGRANRDENGVYYIEGVDGLSWDGVRRTTTSSEVTLDGRLVYGELSYGSGSGGGTLSGGTSWGGSLTWSDSLLWSDAGLWNEALLWGDGFLWADGLLWGDGYMWSDSFLWSDALIWSDALTEPMSINVWVDQE